MQMGSYRGYRQIVPSLKWQATIVNITEATGNKCVNNDNNNNDNDCISRVPFRVEHAQLC